MHNVNSTKDELCLAIGAGAIGKSVTGFVFRQIGCRVIFADINPDVIDDLNRRTGYRIRSTQTGLPSETIKVSGVSAFYINSPEISAAAMHADYLCTSVGANALRILLPVITGWIRQRADINPRKLFLMLFENDAECLNILTEGVCSVLGAVPEWLVVVRSSIERMTKPDKNEQNEFDVIAEQFIPVILPKQQFIGSTLEPETGYFEFVDSVEAYYSRKLYTNNLGHAILGYMGTHSGYKNTIDAIGDPFINKHLIQAMRESGRMLVRRYGFAEDAMEHHLESLIARYRNEDFSDSLSRLVRDPWRKLGRNERIVGAVCNCIDADIYPESIIATLFYAADYRDPDDPSACALAKIMDDSGIAGVLSGVCGIAQNETIHSMVCKSYAEFKSLNADS
ncbi:MAG: mannitol dehydrogenase family protein [Saccharofermentanales bacterium]